MLYVFGTDKSSWYHEQDKTHHATSITNDLNAMQVTRKYVADMDTTNGRV